jgi:hypothetical protein
MATLIPLAIGYGITEERMDTMTYAEIIREVNARADRSLQDLRNIDILFAGVRSHHAALHGVEGKAPKDYLMFPENAEEDQDNSPDAVADRLFKSLKNASVIP